MSPRRWQSWWLNWRSRTGVSDTKVEEIMVSRGLVTVPSTATVADALSRMKKTGVHQVPVLTGKRYVGMLSYREVLRRRSIRSNSKVETFMIKTARLSPSADVKVALRQLRNSGLAALPVVSSGKLVGILSRTDILKNFQSIVGSTDIRALEVMTGEPLLIEENEPVDKAMNKFRSLDETEMPVVSSENKYIGILRVDQISMEELLKSTPSVTSGNVSGESEKLKISTGSLTLRNLSVEPATPIEKCAELMVSNKVRAIPVTDSSGGVMGVVSASDVIGAIGSGDNRGGILIQVSGLEPWDDDLYDILYHNASKLVTRLPSLAGIRGGNFDFHVAKYHSEGRTKYSIRSRLIGGSTNMSINDYDWNFGKCIDRIMATYENRLTKRKEK